MMMTSGCRLMTRHAVTRSEFFAPSSSQVKRPRPAVVVGGGAWQAGVKNLIALLAKHARACAAPALRFAAAARSGCPVFGRMQPLLRHGASLLLRV